MAASDHQQTEAVQTATDEKWVFLQSDGEATKEELLEEQDGDARGGNTGSFLRCIHSAWNDLSIRNALWDERRRYVLVATLCVNTVLHALAVLASLTECGTMQALFIGLKHFTTATLSAAVFSMATRFLSLTAVKESRGKIQRNNFLTGDLVFTNGMILLAACLACTYEVRAGIMVLQQARREENFVWYLQLLTDMARVQVLAGSVVLANALVVLMGIDARDSFRAHLYRIQEEVIQHNAQHPNDPYPLVHVHTRSTLLRINDIILIATLGRLLIILVTVLGPIINVLCLGVRKVKALLGRAPPAASSGI